MLPFAGSPSVIDGAPLCFKFHERSQRVGIELASYSL